LLVNSGITTFVVMLHRQGKFKVIVLQSNVILTFIEDFYGKPLEPFVLKRLVAAFITHENCDVRKMINHQLAA
jgi:hypothetical protein